MIKAERAECQVSKLRSKLQFGLQTWSMRS